MPATRFKMNAGWKRMEKALDPGQMSAVMKRHLRRATRLNGKMAVAAIRREITSGSYEPNAPLTVALKGGLNEPLKGTRAGSPLFKSITSKAVNDLTVFVGILQTNDAYNIALAIHEGISIAVTDKMRGLFSILAAAERDAKTRRRLTGRAEELWEQMPGGWRPLKPSTRFIIIPKRPFVKQAIESPKLRRDVQRNWRLALEAAMKEQAGE